jgi:Na+-transporting NADH:ubiquinone oxidoreductase subunit C
LLKVTGYGDEDINRRALEVFGENFDVTIIDIETGEEAIDACHAALVDAGKKLSLDELKETPMLYNQAWASGSKLEAVCEKLDSGDDTIRIRYREKFSHVFILRNEDESVKNYVFPVRGYGLWSMMHGYLALEPDLTTVVGITFYEHGETPGLGGEITSERFITQWPGKQVFDGADVRLGVIKNGAKDNYTIDSLSGATITSNGVTNLIRFWMGPNGFKPFIEKQKSKSSSAQLNGSIQSIDTISSDDSLRSDDAIRSGKTLSQQQETEAANHG